MDYVKMAASVASRIGKYGRGVTIYQLSGTDADPQKPWRGPGVATRINPVVTTGVFVTPATSIPTESRGLAFDWVNSDLIAQVRELCLVPATMAQDLTTYHELVDSSGVAFQILWGQCLMPGPVRLMYVLGLKQ